MTWFPHLVLLLACVPHHPSLAHCLCPVLTAYLQSAV
uniref:Uncharacterized protein n=1 Tax=Anguilla anguilla TaxID=7936 RepID=A0A0E9RNA5_ANGAN